MICVFLVLHSANAARLPHDLAPDIGGHLLSAVTQRRHEVGYHRRNRRFHLLNALYLRGNGDVGATAWFLLAF